MGRFLSTAALVGLSAFWTVLPAQQTPSIPTQDSTSQQPTNSKGEQSARIFEGRVMRSGQELVLEDRASQTSYKLDEQEKAKIYLGQNVKVMAVMDSTSNTLRVIDITSVEKPQ